MSTQLESVLSRLKGVSRNGEGVMALCPAHEDLKPSVALVRGNSATDDLSLSTGDR